MAHRVVVVGGGFGGIRAVDHLRNEPVEITLIDRRNFHLFQPLTYQVATGALGPSEIAYPLREIFHDAENVRVMLADVTGFDLEKRTVELGSVGSVNAPEKIEYDTLIVGGGSSYSYFGNDEFAEHALEVKTLESAETVRARLLSAFEEAENSGSSGTAPTFVVVGAGPTGVEVAGQIAELARRSLRGNFRKVDPARSEVILLDAVDSILNSFPASLQKRAARALEQMGVSIRLGQKVVDVDASGVTVERRDGTRESIQSRNVIWAAGVTASPLAKQLAELCGGETDRSGRLITEPDLTLPGHPEVFAIGDMVQVRGPDGAVAPLPGLAPVAIQQGKYVAHTIARRLRGEPVKPFRYLDKGNVATIGRGRAIVDVHGLHLSGFPAWVVWLAIHIYYLVGFRNRVLVVVEWTISFFTSGRGSRLIGLRPER